MPLPTPKLDDRKFQNIVDEAKRLIPRYCPEWTDHNVSDPGVAMIELFAWMSEMLLYRVNQVPEKNYIKFLEMIGVRLNPPRPARAPVTFYLSAPLLDKSLTIKRETEVATVRTETSPAVVFATERELVLHPPELLAVYAGDEKTGNKLLFDKAGMVMDGRGISPKPAPIFPDKLPGEAMFLALANNVGHHVLALDLDCVPGEIRTPDQSPISWQAWQGDWRKPWLPCEIEDDQTNKWAKGGELVLRLPEMKKTEMFGITAYWLCCRLLTVSGNQHNYTESPSLRQLKKIETRGGTASARHALAVAEEILGQSDGAPGQIFKLHHAPVLPLNQHSDHLIVKEPGDKDGEAWREVRDFASSDKDDPHFTLDHATGEIMLGPALLQPDNSIRQFGKVPPHGSQLMLTRYQHGGGTVGNVPAGALCELGESLPYIAGVTNHQNAIGGRNAQTLSDAKLRAPQALRAADRAVSAEDYESLATEVPGVKRALCLAAGLQPTDPKQNALPGTVQIYVLPEIETIPQPIPEAMLRPSQKLLNEVKRFLTRRSLPGVDVMPSWPIYRWIKVEAILRLSPHAEDRLLNQSSESPATESLKAEIEAQATDALHRYLNPHTGGPQGYGWPFGRKLHRFELENLLLRIPGVEVVRKLELWGSEPDKSASLGQPVSEVVLEPRSLICSTQHKVIVEFADEKTDKKDANR